MTYKSKLVLFIVLLLVLAPLRMAQAQDQYEQQVLAQLGEAAMVFTSAGYAPILVEEGNLTDGDSEAFTVVLETGHSYMLMGVCDEDCLDLDLELYDGYGNLVSQDESEDNAPIVEVSVATSGEFTLRVTMYDCTEDPCYYGVGVYGESQDQYEQQVLQQLGEVAMVFTSAGYTPMFVEEGKLNDGDTQAYTVTLETGQRYALMGVCDEDCLDLDLELFDGYGNLVSRDESHDDAPIVEVSEATGGEFMLQVTMYDCNANPCYFGLGLYRE